MSTARGWRACGCYAWRTRKPHAFLGLPLIGRHWAYVGETNSRYFRDAQHMGVVAKGSRYASVAQPWSDLDPKVYSLPCLFPHWAWARKTQETLWTLVLWPVYPEQKNKWNPRRIPKVKAAHMRAQRELQGLKVNVGRAIGRAAVLAVFWTLVVIIVIEAVKR